jgi:nicotinamidase-related amidase
MINLISFIHNKLKKIDRIKVSLDTHSYNQIFYKSWWQDTNGNHPDYFTIINKNSKFKPIFHEKHSIDYINYLEKTNKELIIWPYHCILGTYGHNIEPNLENILSYFSLVTKKKVEKITKGSNPLSEMYGIFKDEFSSENTTMDSILAKAYGKYENIIIAGEAKSHCVLETVKQLCEFYKFKDFNSTIFILEDCTSSINGYEEKTNEEFNKLKSKFNIVLTNSKKITL